MGLMRCDIQVLSWFCFAVENQAHCDFVKLRNMLIRTHMHDLKDVTCDVHYENYRAQCIQQMTRWVPHFACGLEGYLCLCGEGTTFSERLLWGMALGSNTAHPSLSPTALAHGEDASQNPCSCPRSPHTDLGK